MTLATSVFDWTKHLRYVRIGRTAKLVGLMLATFADPDGTNAYPGVARLAVACGLDYKTVKRALADLLAAGLVDVDGGHSGRRGQYNVYRLTLPELPDVDVYGPNEFNNEVERVRDANRRKPGTGKKSPHTKAEVQGTAVPVPDAEPEQVRGLSVPQNGEVRGTGVPQYGDFPSAVPIPTPVPVITSPSSDEDLPTAVTVTREPEPLQSLFSDEKFEDPPRLGSVTPIRRGLGFCIPCYADGKTVIAADPESGDACTFHLRQEAS